MIYELSAYFKLGINNRIYLFIYFYFLLNSVTSFGGLKVTRREERGGSVGETKTKAV